MNLYPLFVSLCLCALLIISCSTKNNSSSNTEITISQSNEIPLIDSTVSIFNTSIHLDEEKAIRELSAAGILKCDTFKYNNEKFENAIIEFAGVKFCMNKGFLFLTSRQDKQAIDSLVNHISRYYGEPSIDDEGEPEWSYYHWNLYDTIPDRPYIRIRPVHSEEGGLMMTWSFNE